MLCNFCLEIAGLEPSRRWPGQFVQQWKDELGSGYMDRLEAQRVKADVKASYEDYFTALGGKFEAHDIKPGNIYNIDEKGFMVGWSSKQHQVFLKSASTTGRLRGALHDGNREWITLLAGICADGSSLPPVLIVCLFVCLFH